MAHQEIHCQVVALLASLEGKGEAHALLNYLSPQLQDSFQSILQGLDSLPPEGFEEYLRARLKALHAQESFSGIAEIHPAWLLEALKKESPRVIGVILRHLPSKHVRYLLEQLPKRIVMKLPKLIEAFYVPNEILNLIRRRFERHFVPMHISHQMEQMEFDHLYYLKMEELDCLFYELGLSELSLSLVGSPRQMIKVILNRFCIRDAKAILNKLKQHHGEEKWLLKDAKYSILELGAEEIGAERFLRELGLLALAKAFESSDLHIYELLKQKLSPESAYLFKRYLDEQVLRFKPQWAARRKGWVMEHVLDLSEKGAVDRLWSGHSKKQATRRGRSTWGVGDAVPAA